MPVGRGDPWGAPATLRPDAVVVDGDAALAAAVVAARQRGSAAPIGLVGGDLARTVGVAGDRPPPTGREGTLLPIDLGVAILDGAEDAPRHFVAHAVARRRWWTGRIVAVCNAQYLGSWDVAPRSHPNDGLLDVVDVEGALGLGDRFKAYRRLPSGAHVPHPAIAQRRTASWETTFARPTPLWLDGRPAGPVRHLAVHVEPDAFHVVI